MRSRAIGLPPAQCAIACPSCLDKEFSRCWRRGRRSREPVHQIEGPIGQEHLATTAASLIGGHLLRRDLPMPDERSSGDLQRVDLEIILGGNIGGEIEPARVLPKGWYGERSWKVPLW